MASGRCDIVVVGAGIVGCAVAYELARRGASVQIVDDRPAGMGATQASAGVLAPYIEARQTGPLLELTTRSLGLFDKFIARVSSVSGMPIMYQRTGTLDVALSEDALRRVTWSERCYLVPWEDGTLLVGATVEEAGFDERTTTAGVRDLIEAACELVPHAWTATFVGARAGLRPTSTDELPVIGASMVI